MPLFRAVRGPSANAEADCASLAILTLARLAVGLTSDPTEEPSGRALCALIFSPPVADILMQYHTLSHEEMIGERKQLSRTLKKTRF